MTKKSEKKNKEKAEEGSISKREKEHQKLTVDEENEIEKAIEMEREKSISDSISKLEEIIGKSKVKLEELSKDFSNNERSILIISKLIRNSEKEKQELEESLKKNSKEQKGGFCFIIFVFIFFGFMIFSKLNEEFYSRFIWSAEESFYDTFGISPSSSTAEIKSKYRELVIKYHPDKNPNCEDCTKIFSKIQNAYEVLGDKDKRAAYDETNGVLNFIKSNSFELTEKNFKKLVVESDWMWFIQVYENGSNMCEHFSHFWEDALKKYPFLHFARVNYRTQKSVLKQLPFGINELPFVMFVKQSQDSEFCDLKRFDNIQTKLEKFIEKSFSPNSIVSNANENENYIEFKLKNEPKNKIDFLYYSQHFKKHFGIQTVLTIDKSLEENELVINAFGKKERIKISIDRLALYETIKNTLFSISETKSLSREFYKEFCISDSKCLFVYPNISSKFTRIAKEYLFTQNLDILKGKSKFLPEKMVYIVQTSPNDHPKLNKRLLKNQGFLLIDHKSNAYAQLSIGEIQTIEDIEDLERSNFESLETIQEKEVEFWEHLRPSDFSFFWYCTKMYFSNLFSLNFYNVSSLVLFLVFKFKTTFKLRYFLLIQMSSLLIISAKEVFHKYG